MPRALGQTTNPRDLIPGDPEQIAADLRALAGTVHRVDDTGDRLSRIDAANWKGDASTAFHRAFGAEPPRWARAAELLAQGGQALADYGTTLAWGQGEAQRAIELYTQAQTATRQAAAAHDTRVQFGMPVGPFVDPGAATAREAQTVLANARTKVAKAGDDAATSLGFEPDGNGGFTKKLGDRNYGTDHRATKRHWDEKQKKWVDEDPGGWQKTKGGGRTYQGTWGSQSDGRFTGELDDTLKALGIKLPERTWTSSVGVDMANGQADGQFHTGPLSGNGTIQGSVLGADGQWYAGVSPLGVSAGAGGDAYLGKASASGQIDLGTHVSLAGAADAADVGAHGNADGGIGLLGGHASGDVFAGVDLNEQASAEVGGIKAGAEGSAQFGIGAGGSVQAGFDHGKIHFGGSAHVAFGPGANVGLDVTVDPREVADTMGDAAKAVGHTASGFARGAVGGVTGFAEGAAHLFGI